jgi:NADH dehydrogenase FAD-containing subunit
MHIVIVGNGIAGVSAARCIRKNNKAAKELIVFRFKDIPAYVTIKREQYTHLLDFIHSQAVGLEMYELCAKVLTIKKEL